MLLTSVAFVAVALPEPAVEPPAPAPFDAGATAAPVEPEEAEPLLPGAFSDSVAPAPTPVPVALAEGERDVSAGEAAEGEAALEADPATAGALALDKGALADVPEPEAATEAAAVEPAPEVTVGRPEGPGAFELEAGSLATVLPALVAPAVV